MLFISLTMLGIVSYKQLPVELIPNAESPTLTVSVSAQQEMDPSYIESEVIIPLEGAISSIGGVERLTSTVNASRSSISVEFKSDINIKTTTLKLEEKMKEVSTNLPDGFTVRVQANSAMTMASSTILMQLQVRGTGGVDRVRNIVDEKIAPVLENIDGVAAVNVYGGRQKAIEVRINKDACLALNLTTARIASILRNNAQEKTFAGNAYESNTQYFVHVSSPYTKVSELENIVIAPGPILLKDVAEVFFDLKEETSYSRVNGMEAISVSLVNDAQSNLIDLSHRALAVVEQLNKDVAYLDAEIVVEMNAAEAIENNINDLIQLALIGGLLAVIILWFFLRNIKLVFFIAVAMPISVYSAFNFFYYADISINMLTLLGMMLAVGLLIDNSVVVLESIYRLFASGLSAEKAVVQGTTEVWRSIVAATLTTVTVFIPFIFTDDAMIKLFGMHIGVSIISTLLISMAVALLFVPMVAYAILKNKKTGSAFFENVTITQRPVQIYLVFLKSCLRNPGIAVFGAVILLVVSVALLIVVSVTQTQEVETDRFNINVTMRTGTTIETTDKLVRVIEERLQEVPEKKDVSCRVNGEEATITLILQEDYEKIGGRTMSEIRADVQANLPNADGAQVRVGNATGGSSSGSGSVGSARGNERAMTMMGVGSSQERIVIRGSDYDLMQAIAEPLRSMLSEQEFIASSRVSFPRRAPEIWLDFDQILLSSYDISRNNITTGLNELNSETSSNTTFKVNDENYDIIIRDNSLALAEAQGIARRQRTIDDLYAVQVPNANDGLHNLVDIAAINKASGRSQITRVNQDKQIDVTYSFIQSITGSNALLESYRADIDELVASIDTPSGIAIQTIHEEEQFLDFEFLIMVALVLVLVILACVFESITTPFVMIFTIPLAAIGAVLALLFTGNSFSNISTFMGLLILVGIVTNNGIILIDYANLLRKRGYRRERALMTAGLSRIRPILITSITTIIALMPMAMTDSQYAGIIGAPFAITVIGGLAFSSLLTLVLIPTVYMGLENTLIWYREQKLYTKLLHLAIFLIGSYCIYMYVSGGLLYQALYFFVLIFVIPGVTYFMQTSLKRAKADIVDPKKDIQITVSNLVKVYDRPGRFSRQWESGLLLRQRLGLFNEYHSLKDFSRMIWQFLLWGFLIYFTYFFTESKIWIFTLSIAVYAYTLYLWRAIRAYLYFRFKGSKIVKHLNRIIFWALPVIVMYNLGAKLENIAMTSIIGVLLVIGIAIYVTSQYLYSKNVNVERIEGRFAGFKRSFFRMVKSVPIIGKQRRPFKALRGVSFNISTGMFGLLGPNGAGKSTMMRIVTGILEQSYGSIWINGLDTRVYREELQSLIGFLPQEFGMYENMSAWEFLDYEGMMKGLTDSVIREERINYVLKAVHMHEKKDHKIGSFSGGMKQRIGIALILLHLPRILVVDEPTAGLDPRERIRFRNLLVELSKERIVIFSTHIIEDISSSCNQVVVINKGEMKYFGDPLKMIDMAIGKVWTFLIDRESFEEKLDKALVINNMQDGDMINVRYLSKEQPYPGAVLVEANLEDAYLCLLKNM